MADNVTGELIANFPEATGANDENIMIIEDTEATKKIKFSTLITSIIDKLGAAATKAVANNMTTTEEGSVMDARQGPIIDQRLNELNTKLIKIRAATTVKAFSDGVALIPISELHLSTRPNVLAITSQSQNAIIRYDYDGSTDTQIRLEAYVVNSVNYTLYKYTGNLRFCYFACSDIISN